ncbi:MAG: hypothetical protein KIS67_10050 [Verrucomicrobiae bacterium]|nr:hypothetical protein [Verrucomicrobiae bacterium]
MKVILLTEEQIDDGIETGRFNRIVDDDEQNQHGLRVDRLNIALEKLLCTKYGENMVFVSDNVWSACSLGIEVGLRIVNVKLISELLEFLNTNCPDFSIKCGVYDPDLSANTPYCGRFVLTVAQLAIEETLRNRLDLKRVAH